MYSYRLDCFYICLNNIELLGYIPNGAEGFLDVKSMVRNAYDEQVELIKQEKKLADGFTNVIPSASKRFE